MRSSPFASTILLLLIVKLSSEVIISYTFPPVSNFSPVSLSVYSPFLRAFTILAVSPDVHWIPITFPSLSVTLEKSLSALFASKIDVQSIPAFVIASRAPLISFSPVISCLLIVNSFGASSMMIRVPSSDIEVLPVVTAPTVLTFPFSSTNVNLETTSYPSGETFSISEYLPFFRYSKFAEFP